MFKVYYDDLCFVTVESKELIDKIAYKGQKLVSKDNGYTIEELDVRVANTLIINNSIVPIEMRGIVKTSWFESQFNYDGQLGSMIIGDKTIFRLWAPTSQSVNLKLEDTLFPMIYVGRGVYELIVSENLEGSSYLFEVNRNGVSTLLTDPYAKASLPNRVSSIVIDENKLNGQTNRFHASQQPIILEMSVRDFSMDETVPFKNRGKFLGLTESYGKYGFNHVKDLGVTHVQLMPVNDFETVDELNPLSKYNWGYDTMQYMSLEGSYSTDVLNPVQAIYDLQETINFYHNHDIGVNLDFVFNHVYDVETHPLHQSVPYYFFRYDSNYTLSNGSFCGNEIASEMVMMRKLIVDTCKYYVDMFDIDGFRFDLMGLLDVDTMNQVKESVNTFGKEVLVYGEGWSMPTVLPKEIEASMKNYHKMPGIAHFNDAFRDKLGGKVDGTTYSIDYGKDSIETINSILNDSYSILGSPKQSINYIECHDNYTLADRLTMHGKSHHDAEILNTLVILSNGVPFIEIGQSFFRDKKGEENSYNLPDSINSIKWNMLDTYSNLNESMKKAIKTRKENSNLYQIVLENGRREIKIISQ